MKKEKILVYLLGVNVLFSLYYFPQMVENLFEVLDGSLLDNISFITAQVLRYIFLGIGIMGIVQYSSSQNINNNFLRIHFLFSAVMFVMYLPSNIHYLFAYRDTLGFSFFFFNILHLIEWVLIILIYGQREERVSVVQNATTSIRLSHHVIDTFFLIFLSLSLSGSLRLILGYGIHLSIELYLSFFLMRFIYYTTAEAIFQQTLGKMVTKRYVTRNNGQRAGLGQIMGRSLTRFIPLEALSLLSNPANGWHDRFSGTNVYQLAEGKATTEEDFLLDHLVEEDEM